MNTKISYLYRDAGNYKQYNECIMHDFFSTALTSSGIRLSCWQQPNYSIT